jgi:DNA-binding protein HU-beta
MNKGELVDAIATQTEMSKKQIEQVLSVILEVIQETVAGGEKITLVGFGSFEARHRSAREGRNPKTGEPMMISAVTVPAFSAGKLFKERVSGNGSEDSDDDDED